MKKKTIYLLLAHLFSFQLSAEVAEPFLLENFDNGFPTNWTTGDDSGQGVLWQQCDNPSACPPSSYVGISCSDPLFKAPGFHDGYVYMDSYGADPLQTPSISYLRTGSIDCSQKAKVFLRFYTYIHSVYSDPETNAVLRVKSGNGPWQEFTIFPDLNHDVIGSVQGYNAQLVQLDISSAAANSQDVTIEWRWKANFEIAWMIDDVELFDENPMFENIVWGQTAGDFSTGLSGWSVVNNQLDTCRWVWVDSSMIHLPNGDSQASAIACWPGVNDGAMLLNASYCSRFGLPTTFTRSDLQSPTVNLGNVPIGTKLFLQFNQAVAVANIASVQLPRTSIAISINNGISYMDTIDANPGLQYLHAECGEARVPLPLEVAGSQQVKLRFIFSGDTHFWMVDDVRISLALEHDIEINPHFFNVAPDYGVPASQVRPIKLFAQTRNVGLFETTDVKAYVAVKNQANETVFMDSIAIGNLVPGGGWTDLLFEEKFTPAPTPEKYLIYYWVSTSSGDSYQLNNRAYWQYQVTEDVFSKNEFCSTSVGYFFPTSSVSYEIGNCYYVPKGSKLKAKSISFAFKEVLRLADENAVLDTRLYKWSKGSNKGDVNNDTLANVDEFELVALNDYEVMGTENEKVVTVPISFQTDDEIILEDDTYYFATVGYLDPVVVNNQQVRFPIAASEAVNYTAMFYNSLYDTLPAFVSMLREGDEVDFKANGWALRRIPFLNLNVADYVSSTTFVGPETGKVHISPNPSTDFVWLSTEIPSNNQPIRIEIFDLCGRKMFEKQLPTGNVTQMSIPVGGLCNGSYMLRVVSGAGIYSEKLLIAR